MYYLTNVILSQDLNPCIKKNGKWIPTYRWRRDIGLHFGFRDPTYIGRVTSDDNDSRQVRKIVVHPGYDIKGIFILLSSIEAIRKTFLFTDRDVSDDIALVKFKPFDYSKWGKKDEDDKGIKINPVCLPESSFPDEDQVGFVIGLGNMYQDTCRTNGGGPEMYRQCAPGY